MKSDKIEALLARYYEGETTVSEEQFLKDFFGQTRLLPDHLKPHAAQFTCYAGQQQTKLDKYLAEDWLFEKIEAPAAPEASQYTLRLPRVLKYWRVAASITLLLTSLWAGNHYRERRATQQDPEIATLRRELQEMKTVLAANSSASDRIRVVSQDFSAVQDEEVIDMLIKTLYQDPNINVRLAACEGLYQFKDKPRVRLAFIQALEKQTDPMVQITLIDILVSLQEKKALEPLKQLTEKENLLPAVKQKARQGIGTLI
jgi:hypothetical protein